MTYWLKNLETGTPCSVETEEHRDALLREAKDTPVKDERGFPKYEPRYQEITIEQAAEAGALSAADAVAKAAKAK